MDKLAFGLVMAAILIMLITRFVVYLTFHDFGAATISGICLLGFVALCVLGLTNGFFARVFKD